MRDLPNLHQSRKISELCDRFNLTDPFRLLCPERLDYSFAPWGNMQNNRSRLDFFLISKKISESVDKCNIKPAVQSKLFHHKAICVWFAKKKTVSSRPNITEINGITVILGSIYGPNIRENNFFVNLSNSIERLGDFPVVIGGDWNATLSCIPVDDNPDVLNMRDLPNLHHSRKISELCDRFN